MRVLHFCRAFSPLSETFIYDYVTELERQDIENHVVTRNHVNAESRPFPRVTEVDWPNRWHPRRLLRRALVPFGSETPRTSAWPLMQDRLREQIESVQPDVIHAHFGPEGVLIAPAAIHFGIPIVVTFYGYDVSQLFEHSFWRDRYQTLWTQADAVTTLSQTMRDAVKSVGCPGEKAHVIHLSRDLSVLPFTPPRGGPVRNLVSVGRLVDKKGHDNAIEVVHCSRQRGIDVRLDVYGGGKRHDTLTSRVDALGLNAHITFHGSVSNDAVLQAMQEADAFLLCSKTAPNGDQEGTPTVLVEAQAIGLPCITTRHAGIPEMIPESNHRFLAPEGDVDAIADTLVDLASLSLHERQAIAERGRRYVEDAFNLKKEVESLRDLYASIAFSETTY